MLLLRLKQFFLYENRNSIPVQNHCWIINMNSTYIPTFLVYVVMKTKLEYFSFNQSLGQQYNMV